MAITSINVHGEILEADLTPAVGTVTFRIIHELRDTVDNIVLTPTDFVATLDVNGEFTIALPTTDNPDITPLNWSYQVYVSVQTWRSKYYVQLPVALGPTAEFADLLPIDGDGTDCTPDGTACAPISLVGEVATLQADLDTVEVTVGALVGQVNTITPIVLQNQADITALETQILNIDGAWITTGTLPYQRLGGDIVEADTVAFNRPTLVNPPTAADMWQFRYNGNRVVYANEYACLRVRGVPDNQVPARFMSNVARDNTSLAVFQVGLSDATTYWFQVLGDGQILGPNSLSMLPSTSLAVTYTGNMGNAALINDGVAINTGAPYAVTTTLHASDNRVYLDGNMANNGGVAIPAQTTLFTIAAAHRPTAWCQFSLRSSTNLAVRLTIKGATGIVVADQSMAAGATLNLDGLNYRKS